MKPSLILFVIVLMTYSCSTKDIKSSLKNLNIKGNVRGFINIEYYAKEKFGEATKDTIVKEIWSLYSAPKNYVKTFNNRGDKIEELVLFGGNPEHKAHYYYNDGNKLLYVDVLDANRKLKQKIKYDYSKIGMIEQKNYDSDGNLIINLTSTLDDQQRVVKVKMNDTDYQTYIYNGDTLTINELDDSRIFFHNVILKKINKGQTTEYKYNENGDLIEEINSVGIKEYECIYKYDYKYDNKKNWVEKRSYLVIGDKIDASQTPYTITYREFDYGDQENYIMADSLYARSHLKKIFDEESVALNIQKYCNKETVISLFKNHIKLNNPNLEIFANTISIVEDEDRKYLIGVIVRDHNAQDQMRELVIEFTYNELFTNFFVIVKSEKNI
jgi:YD repeat-containing protein